MAKPRKKTRQSRVLVLGYLERISSKIFQEFPKQLTDLVGRQHGVYALYKGKRLYYIGLATNLRNRIKHHLRDRHAEKWDGFSLYLIRKEDHIRELEAIVMRVADPAGNAARGKLGRAVNLKSDLKKRVKAEQKRQVDALMGKRPRRVTSIRKPVTRKSKGKPTLAPYVKKGFRIRGESGGKVFSAVVYRTGTIKYAGNLYKSPCAAATAARRRGTNGWSFWKFRTKSGEWVKLRTLKG